MRYKLKIVKEAVFGYIEKSAIAGEEPIEAWHDLECRLFDAWHTQDFTIRFNRTDLILLGSTAFRSYLHDKSKVLKSTNDMWIEAE